MKNIYDLVKDIKEARADLKAMQEIRNKKVQEIKELGQNPSRRNSQLIQDIEISLILLRAVIDVQWNTVQYIQSEIDEIQDK